MSHSVSAIVRNLGLAAAGTIMLAAASAGAQSYYDNRDSYRSNEEVIVTAPPYQGRGATTGAPIRDVSMTREIRVDDLDLRSHWGERALYSRIRMTARTLCDKMDRLYPVSADNSPDCYRTAVDGAMAQAYDLIDRARSGD